MATSVETKVSAIKSAIENGAANVDDNEFGTVNDRKDMSRLGKVQQLRVSLKIISQEPLI